jgi:hypothetical protein
MRRVGTIVAIAVVAGVIECTSMTPQQQGTVSGASVRPRGQASRLSPEAVAGLARP